MTCPDQLVAGLGIAERAFERGAIDPRCHGPLGKDSRGKAVEALVDQQGERPARKRGAIESCRERASGCRSTCTTLSHFVQDLGARVFPCNRVNPTLRDLAGTPARSRAEVAGRVRIEVLAAQKSGAHGPTSALLKYVTGTTLARPALPQLPRLD